MKIKARAPIIRGVIRAFVERNASPVEILFEIASPATTPISTAVLVAVIG